MTEVGGEGWGGEGGALGLAEVSAIILGEGGIDVIDVVEAFPRGGRVFGVCGGVRRNFDVFEVAFLSFFGVGAQCFIIVDALLAFDDVREDFFFVLIVIGDAFGVAG